MLPWRHKRLTWIRGHKGILVMCWPTTNRPEPVAARSGVTMTLTFNTERTNKQSSYRTTIGRKYVYLIFYFEQKPREPVWIMWKMCILVFLCFFEKVNKAKADAPHSFRFFFKRWAEASSTHDRIKVNYARTHAHARAQSSLDSMWNTCGVL